jgi:hypothetical protein
VKDSPEIQPAEQTAAPPQSLALLVIILASLTAFSPLSIDMYLPSFPQIAADFGAPVAQVELSLATFFAGLSFGQLLYGTATDRFGRAFLALNLLFGARKKGNSRFRKNTLTSDKLNSSFSQKLYSSSD